MMRRRVVLAVLLVACGSGSYGSSWRARHPDFTPAPVAAGAGFSETLASLDLSPASGTRVSITDLRVMRVRDGAWQTLEPEQAESDPGRIGAVVQRRCRLRQGFRRLTVERASWYLFQAGQLTAFDHTEFESDCKMRRSFRSSPARDEETEQTLLRWVAQRNPGSKPDAADRIRLGIARVEAGRLDEGEAALAAGDRVIEDLAQQRKHLTVDDAEGRTTLEEREQELRALRAVLDRAIRAARAAEAAKGPA
jgi:hypothetical protein